MTRARAVPGLGAVLPLLALVLEAGVAQAQRQGQPLTICDLRGLAPTYALTKNRSLQTIERFLDAFIDRAANEDRGTEELMLDSPEAPHPAVTLSNAIRRGLDYPRRGCTIYLTPRDPAFEQVILRFTTDDQLILGLAIDDTGGHPQNEARARAVLRQLITDYDCSLGAILSEQAPPRDERAFRALEHQPFTVFVWARISG